MDYKINNNVSNDRNDWRFRDQDGYLMCAKLTRSNFDISIREHDHCEFCFEKFNNNSQYGYHTLDNYYWICVSCFDDFRKMFNWEIV